MIRSLLFVPGDSERKLVRAEEAGADALVLDLEDAVMPDRKNIARTMIRTYLSSLSRRDHIWVRINDLASGESLKDLVSIIPAPPAGILVPKIRGPEDLATMGHYLDLLEAEHGLLPRSMRIMAIVTETPSAVLRASELLAQAHPRISHVTWGAEDLAASIGAGDPRNSNGAWRPLYEHARLTCLLLAHALGTEVLDTVYVDFRDPEGLRNSCQASRHDGFTGRIAIHPDQVSIINQEFSVSDAERHHAQRIIDAFKSGAGTVSIDGKMYDAPHLKAARRVLGLRADSASA